MNINIKMADIIEKHIKYGKTKNDYLSSMEILEILQSKGVEIPESEGYGKEPETVLGRLLYKFQFKKKVCYVERSWVATASDQEVWDSDYTHRKINKWKVIINA